MAKIEFDPGKFRLIFECADCGATSDDPDRVSHASKCTIGAKLEELRQINRMSDALLHACNDLGINLHQCAGWPGSMAVARHMFAELN